MHIHIGVLEAIRVFLYVVVVGFLWRLVASHNSDNEVGKAMAFIY